MARTGDPPDTGDPAALGHGLGELCWLCPGVWSPPAPKSPFPGCALGGNKRLERPGEGARLGWDPGDPRPTPGVITPSPSGAQLPSGGVSWSSPAPPFPGSANKARPALLFEGRGPNFPWRGFLGCLWLMAARQRPGRFGAVGTSPLAAPARDSGCPGLLWALISRRFPFATRGDRRHPGPKPSTGRGELLLEGEKPEPKTHPKPGSGGLGSSCSAQPEPLLRRSHCRTPRAPAA